MSDVTSSVPLESNSESSITFGKGMVERMQSCHTSASTSLIVLIPVEKTSRAILGSVISVNSNKHRNRLASRVLSKDSICSRSETLPGRQCGLQSFCTPLVIYHTIG